MSLEECDSIYIVFSKEVVIRYVDPCGNSGFISRGS